MTDVPGDAHEVAHHLQRLAKNPLIDLLMHISYVNTALVIGSRVCFIDVPDLAKFGMSDLPVDLKLFGDVSELNFVVHQLFPIIYCRV